MEFTRAISIIATLKATYCLCKSKKQLNAEIINKETSRVTHDTGSHKGFTVSRETSK